MGSPATYPDEGTHKSKLLPEGTLTDPKNSRRNVQLTDRGLPSTNVIDQSWMLMEDFDDELKELSDDDILEAGEDIDDPFPLPTDEETQPPPSTKQP
ncbi:hypothetical protein Tco_1571338 [Tanacetum coccineum]